MVDLVLAGLLLALVGMGIMVASIASHSGGSGGEVKGGGVVMIGPIPIVFGSDAKWASIAMILAMVLIVVSLILAVI